MAADESTRNLVLLPARHGMRETHDKKRGEEGEREREKITPTIWHASVCPHKPLPRIQEHDYPHTYMHTRPGAHTHLSILRKTFSNWVVVMIAVIGGDTAPTCQ